MLVTAIPVRSYTIRRTQYDWLSQQQLSFLMMMMMTTTMTRTTTTTTITITITITIIIIIIIYLVYLFSARIDCVKRPCSSLGHLQCYDFVKLHYKLHENVLC